MPRAHWVMSRWWAPKLVSCPPRVVPEEPEQVVDAVRVVRPLRRRPEPAVVVQFGRRVGVRDRLLRPVDPVRAGDADPHLVDLAQPAGPDYSHARRNRSSDRCWLPVWTIRLFLPGRLDHRPPLGDDQRQRLLAVHVLAGVAGVDRHQGVPVVRDGDDHRVHVLAVEHLAVVAAAAGALPLASWTLPRRPAGSRPPRRRRPRSWRESSCSPSLVADADRTRCGSVRTASACRPRGSSGTAGGSR